MKRKAANNNPNDRLQLAISVLLQNQAELVQNQTAFLARVSEMDRLTAERFARIEAKIEQILRVLSEHSRLLEALPEAVREKIGFKVQKQPQS